MLAFVFVADDVDDVDADFFIDLVVGIGVDYVRGIVVDINVDCIADIVADCVVDIAVDCAVDVVNSGSFFSRFCYYFCSLGNGQNLSRNAQNAGHGSSPDGLVLLLHIVFKQGPAHQKGISPKNLVH